MSAKAEVVTHSKNEFLHYWLSDFRVIMDDADASSVKLKVYMYALDQTTSPFSLVCLLFLK